MDNLKLINKDNSIENYIPNDLVITDNNENNFHGYENPNFKPMISKRVYKEFLKLKEAALKDGYDIIIDSGYRSRYYQNDVWFYFLKKFFYEVKDTIKCSDIETLKMAYILTNKRVAFPGCSEHQSGLAFDFACFRDGLFFDEIVGSPEAKWMNDNAFKFGFILRYPQGKESITGFNYEPWHYRFVGYPESLEFYDGHWLTLEEYTCGKRLKKSE